MFLPFELLKNHIPKNLLIWFHCEKILILSLSIDMYTNNDANFPKNTINLSFFFPPSRIFDFFDFFIE